MIVIVDQTVMSGTPASTFRRIPDRMDRDALVREKEGKRPRKM